MPSTQSPDEQERFVRAVEDVTAFPILTEDIGSIGTAGSLGGSPAGAGRPSSYDTVVKSTLRDILNWGPRSLQDPQGFASALAQSFDLKEVAGRTVATYVPRSYVMQVQSDGGAVTGAQASIFARAQAAVQQSIPLLEGLYPLQVDSDPEDLSATVATLRLALTELVDELGRQGGPRPQRVDSLFDLMLGLEITGKPPGTFNSDQVGGQLGLLRDRLGFELSRVNNAQEEKNLTNFLILADYVFTLWLSWTSLRTYFDRVGPDVFLGPQLVLLSRALAVVAEQVRETYFTLDSVFVGPAERETTLLRFPDHCEAPLTIAELLEWAERFASEEATQLMREAGKDGVIAFRPTLQRLVRLFEQAVEISRGDSHNPSPGVHTLRVGNALGSVLLQLRNAEKLTQPLSRSPRPAIDGVTVENLDPVIIRIEGKNFHPQSRVRLDIAGSERHHVEAKRVHFGSESTLWATFEHKELADADDAGKGWTVVVFNPDGTHVPHHHAFTISPEGGEAMESAEAAVDTVSDLPARCKLSRHHGKAGRRIEIAINGQGFEAGTTVNFGKGIGVTVTELSPEWIHVKAAIDPKTTLGTRDVTINVPGSDPITLVDGFEVT